MKRRTALIGLAALFALCFAIPYSVSAWQKEAPQKEKKGGPRIIEIVCHCPSEIWGEEEESPFNEYWLCLNCRDLYFTSETLPDNTVAVDCTPQNCNGCIPVEMHVGIKKVGKPEAIKPVQKSTEKSEKATLTHLKPVKSIPAKKAKDKKLKMKISGSKLLHETTVRFEGQDRSIDARLFLFEIPANTLTGSKKRGKLVVAHGWEIDTTDEPENKASNVVQDGTLYHVTVGSVTYPVLTVQ